MSKAKPSTAKEWDFVLSNGDSFATLTFTRAQIRKFFPGAKIRKNRVVLG